MLDEPTAVLSPLEAEELYATLTRLAQARKSAGADLIQLLPYVATLLVLGFAAGRAAAPRGLGRHADS